MTRIPVESLADGGSYQTAEEAIAAAKGHALQPKARQEAAEFAGRRFVDAWRDSRQWVLEFSGPLWLRVFASGTRVSWAVEWSRPNGAAVTGPVLLEWASGARSCSDPGSVAAGRRGAEFWQFWVNDMGFHVYLRHQRILCFSPVRRRDTGEPILHVWEDD